MTTVEEMVTAGWTCPEMTDKGLFKSLRCGSVTNPREVHLHSHGGYPRFTGPAASTEETPLMGWRCGKHAAMHERRAQKGKEREGLQAAQRQARQENQERVTRANNVAMMLSDAIAYYGGPRIGFEANYDGRELKLTLDAAESLLKSLKEK